MKLNTEPLKNWFGFTRRERRASFILLLIVISVLAVRTIIPEKKTEMQVIATGISVSDTGMKAAVEKARPVYKGKNEQYRVYDRSEKDTLRKDRISRPGSHRPLIDLNSCDTALLNTLPGIGPVLSVRIIRYRTLLGGFFSVSQLKEVYGLPPETFDLIKGRVSADSSSVLKIRINSAGYKEISRLPYFKNYEVTAILKYRELKGRIERLSDLTDNKLITSEKAAKVGPYLSFE